jgi:Ca-activated chloride channel homolog
MADFWARFHFLRPQYLWLLVPLAIGLLSRFVRARRASPWRPFVRAELLEHLERQSSKVRSFAPEALALGLGIGATLLAAGPSYRAQGESGDPAQSPLIVVFELSRSMAETDVSPSRAERARLELADLLRARPTSPTALVVVAGTAHVLMPFTDDVAALLPSVLALSPELMPSDGQNFSAAAKLVEGLMAASETTPAVLLVSDGLPAPAADAFRSLAQKHKLGLIALSLGGEDAERRALGRLVSDDIELRFASRDIKELLGAIANARAGQVPADDGRFWRDEAPTWAWLLALGVAAWFRRGFLLPSRARVQKLSSLALFLSLTGCSPAVEGLWLTPDQQGRLAFERGHYLEAAERFHDPRWKGLSYYAAEKWDQAAATFVTLDSAEGHFLLGNAYAEGGKLQSALHAYQRALEKRPTFRAARRNSERISELLHSLQEDTDIEGAKKAETGNDDDATRPDADELAPRTAPAESPARAPTSEANAVESEVWLKRLSVDPSEFLKRKLAAEAARRGEL